MLRADRYVHLFTWSLVDLTFGVMVASLPVLSAFLPRSWRGVSTHGPRSKGSTKNTTVSIALESGLSQNCRDSSQEGIVAAEKDSDPEYRPPKEWDVVPK